MASTRPAGNELNLRNIMTLAIALRVGLLFYGDYHDHHSSLKYTDVDYRVFSDASHFLAKSSETNLAQGFIPRILSWKLGDPYTRATYRYTPLLAILTLPNEFLHPAFGKVVFAACDLLVGIVLYFTFLRVVRPQKPNEVKSNELATSLDLTTKIQRSAVLWIGGLWLLNPIVANISTRGSAESVLGAMVISTHFLVLSNHLDWAAVLLGLAIHFKLYPVIYGPTILVWIDQQTPLQFFLASITKRRVRFVVLSALSFLLLNLVMFALWGHPFLQHTYLYHLTRRDHRHNFSPYFYPIYLSYGLGSSPNLSSFTAVLRSPLVSFLPQMLLCLLAGVVLARRDLSFAWFVQTMVFVTFNKVCTSQYFMWYLWFLPLVLPKMHISTKRGVTIGLVWVLSQALWLAAAFRLELLGENVYVWVWAASVIFLLSNGFVLGEILSTFKADTLYT